MLHFNCDRRIRTHSKYISYALYLYFSGLSLRRTTAESLSLEFIKRNHFPYGTDGFKSINFNGYRQRKENQRIHNR